MDQPVIVQAFIFNTRTPHKKVAQWVIKLQDLKDDTGFYREEFVNENSQKAKKGEKKLKFGKMMVKNRNTFLDYVMGGCEVKLSVAVDLTSSNEDKKIYPKGSLHQTENIEQNHYYQAIKIIAENLENYDSDKRIPLYGFGGIPT